ncbi:hypothetical protein B0J15DRAFT_410164 [Fusarium solani]|uniref:Zn(2)-C6 fungal-type domain-containing protein n=1 Tax=Fusarium solani TaxID=169388 RepID=A0A9P9G2X2_FUSSL|nr:uncharacterized protein B0J15DRAFT_410164 [Fusarium solani]KAH7231468.1 hypothetical protein B0J15DRAFT_410164 [Fusarium solani]
MPSHGKRSWDASEDNEARIHPHSLFAGASKDYPVCDQCRSRKIRCGRERPHCSNCIRLGLDCEWLGQGKKPNQTTWLSHAVTRLGDRLQKLEDAVSGLQSSKDSQDSETTLPQVPDSPNVTTSPSWGRSCVVRNVGGRERYYGSTSLVSLMQDMAAIIQSNICETENNQASLTRATGAREEILQLAEPYHVYTHVSDGSVLTGPPLVIVEAMIEPYFEIVNPHMPLWTKESFRRLMASAGESSNESDKRAYDSSKLAGALISAQTSLSEDVTSLVFSFAVHVAKSIGLRHWNSTSATERTSTDECQEKHQVMYCMTCLSRAVAWSSGLSFNLPSVGLLERSLSTSSTTSHLATRVALLQLEEQVYSGLYCDDATNQGPDTIWTVAFSRGRQLEDWAANHSEDLDEDQYSGTLSNELRHNLAVRVSSIRALVSWPIPEDASKSLSILDVARRSLRLFQRLWTATSERGHYLDLALLVASYPPVSFFELSRHVLTSQQASEDDWELLHSFMTMVRIFAEWAEENSFMRRLSRFSDVMLRLINASREDKSSGQPESRPTSVFQAYIHTLEPFPGNMAPIVNPYGGDSAASSSRSTSTPISGVAQLMHPASDTEPVSLPAVSASVMSLSLDSFDGGFRGKLSPIGDLEGWIVEPGAPGAPLPPNSMPNFMFQDSGAFSFDRIDLG